MEIENNMNATKVSMNDERCSKIIEGYHLISIITILRVRFLVHQWKTRPFQP